MPPPEFVEFEFCKFKPLLKYYMIIVLDGSSYIQDFLTKQIIAMQSFEWVVMSYIIVQQHGQTVERLNFVLNHSSEFIKKERILNFVIRLFIFIIFPLWILLSHVKMHKSQYTDDNELVWYLRSHEIFLFVVNVFSFGFLWGLINKLHKYEFETNRN